MPTTTFAWRTRGCSKPVCVTSPHTLLPSPLPRRRLPNEVDWAYKMMHILSREGLDISKVCGMHRFTVTHHPLLFTAPTTLQCAQNCLPASSPTCHSHSTLRASDHHKHTYTHTHARAHTHTLTHSRHGTHDIAVCDPARRDSHRPPRDTLHHVGRVLRAS
jgi:hypothetical protein